MTNRTFESEPARRTGTLFAAGVVGPSGSGKTNSMLRLAAGMRRVKKAPTFVVDSNLRRSLHYAPRPGEPLVEGSYQDFQVVHLTAPFDADSWRAAFRHCVERGAGRIIVDCMSDEHEGEGGTLDTFDRTLDDLVDRHFKRYPNSNEDEWKVRERLSDQAWKVAKAPHKQLRLWMWQQPVDWLLGYRAKEKTERRKAAPPQQPKQVHNQPADRNAKPGKIERVSMGWQPIGAEDIVYDLLFKCLLPPMGDGRPNWTPSEQAEKLLVKQPGWFREMFASQPQLNEDLGEMIGRWAAGEDISSPDSRAATSSPRTPPPPAASVAQSPPPHSMLIDLFDACTTSEMFEATEKEQRLLWDGLPRDAKASVAKAKAAAVERIEAERQRANNA